MTPRKIAARTVLKPSFNPEQTMRRLTYAIPLMLATTGLAQASGGFSCDIDDANMVFSVSGGISHGMGAAILGYEATIEIKAESVPEALRQPDLSGAMVHHWLDYPELWLHFYAETTGDAPFASFDLILKAQGTEEELVYEGEYTLHTFDGDLGDSFDLTGKVTCFGE